MCYLALPTYTYSCTSSCSCVFIPAAGHTLRNDIVAQSQTCSHPGMLHTCWCLGCWEAFVNDGIHLIMLVVSPITVAVGQSMGVTIDVQEQRTTMGTSLS